MLHVVSRPVAIVVFFLRLYEGVEFQSSQYVIQNLLHRHVEVTGFNTLQDETV